MQRTFFEHSTCLGYGFGEGCYAHTQKIVSPAERTAHHPPRPFYPLQPTPLTRKRTLRWSANPPMPIVPSVFKFLMSPPFVLNHRRSTPCPLASMTGCSSTAWQPPPRSAHHMHITPACIHPRQDRQTHRQKLYMYGTLCVFRPWAVVRRAITGGCGSTPS